MNKDFLKIQYPTDMIKNINMNHLRRIASLYDIKISMFNKRELIHQIIQKQDYDNPALVVYHEREIQFNDGFRIVKHLKSMDNGEV